MRIIDGHGRIRGGHILSGHGLAGSGLVLEATHNDPGFDVPSAWTAPGEWVVSSSQASITNPTAAYDLRDADAGSDLGSYYYFEAIVTENLPSGFRFKAGVSSQGVVHTGTGTFTEILQSNGSAGNQSIKPVANETGTLTATYFQVSKILSGYP